MYPRAIRNILNVSTQLKRPKSFKNASLVFPALTLGTVQKIISINVNLFERHFCSNSDIPFIPKDGQKRKEFIEEQAEKEISKLVEENPELEKLRKIYELEIDVMRHDGHRVPSQLRSRDWLELLKLPKQSARRKYLDYLFVIEKKNENRQAEKEEKYLDWEKSREDLNAKKESGELIYGVGQNSFLRRIVEPTMNILWKWNSLKAIMYGNKLVFDFSYERYMRQQELNSCAKQVLESYSINRTHDYPFHIYLCNVYMNGELIKRLHRYIPTLFDDDFPMTITEKSFLEVFERDKLVYLSSDAPTMLEKIEPDMAYIIGAYVDKGPKRPVSLAKAKKENLKMAKLPIDKYLHFGHGSGKDLTLNQVTNIMLDAQTGDWNAALKHVPTRKLYEARVNDLERKVKNEYLRMKNFQFEPENKFLRKQKFQSDKTFDESLSEKPKFRSSEVNDFSYAARAKLRNQFNK